MTELLERGFGALLPRRWVQAWEIQAHKARMVKAFSAGAFQAVTLGTPDIRDQQTSNECFGFATVQGHFIECQAMGLPAKLLSPVIPYYEARALMGGAVRDNGSDPDGMIAAWRKYGACDWDLLPFDLEHVNDEPARPIYVQAQRHLATIEPILEVGTEDLWTAIQYTIAVERKPVLVAIDVNQEFMRSIGDVIDDPSGGSVGRLHANCLYAVDPAAGARTANSWGKDWRTGGTALLTPKFLQARVTWAGALTFQPVQKAA